MPRKPRITADMISKAAFEIIQEQGLSNLNIRTLTSRLGCSSQPIFYQFATMDDLRRSAFFYADEYHNQYIMQGMENNPKPLHSFGINYLRFAAQEYHLFQFIFQYTSLEGKDILASISSPLFYPLIKVVQETSQTTLDTSKKEFFRFFLSIHGYASLLANKSIVYNENEATELLSNLVMNTIPHNTKHNSRIKNLFWRIQKHLKRTPSNI